MWINLVVFLFFAAHLNAGSIANNTNATRRTTLIDKQETCSSIDIDEEMKKIGATCLSNPEIEDISGNILRHGLARVVNTVLLQVAQETIGLMELRSVLGFSPPGPWTEYRQPSKEEIAAAPTIEEYYELKEPRDTARSLDSTWYLEKTVHHAINFLDKRFPVIRKIYQCKYAEARRPRAEMTIDRKEVDYMIEEYISIAPRISRSGLTSNRILCRIDEFLAERKKKGIKI